MSLALPTPASVASDRPVYSAWIKVSDLVNKCNGEKAWEQAYCIDYVIGIADVANNERARPIVCIPVSVTQAQLKSIVMKYLALHTEDAGFAAFASVRAALREGFPCEALRMM